MRRTRKLNRALIGLSVLLGGGTVLSDGCINTIASIPICGTVLTFCTPADQLNLFFPMLEVPDFNSDPSCTIPLGCGGSDIFPNIPAGFPGGGASEEPTNNQGGGGVGGGGGGGGGGGI
jgi:hypothetical protein